MTTAQLVRQKLSFSVKLIKSRFSIINFLGAGGRGVGRAKKLWFTTLFCIGIQVDLQTLPAVQASNKIPMLSPQ